MHYGTKKNTFHLVGYNICFFLFCEQFEIKSYGFGEVLLSLSPLLSISFFYEMQ